ncbi:F0F1 ATP synthase subunit gamma [Govanella unica]|uniref:ATP synthase gamma chain n=1 Tax=Govanella unica TaxID=2975056 RepID=A0A9X3TW56_9PROT|nr:F0F1 ATP synthase subunit gamma [Govania unica]MDA5192758.1 F0F1 ATP synthase subunit gamma [Govania unica]
MASLKDLRNRITSVRSTQKITKAMKMVAASKLRRAQDAAEAARPYAERMEGVLASLGASLKNQPGAPALLAGTGKDDVHLLVVATSDRGLCGGFNTNIVRAARVEIRRLLEAGKTIKILTVGRKGAQVLRRDYAGLIVDHMETGHIKRVGFADAGAIGDRILQMFAAGEFDVCSLFYAKFQSALTQIVTKQVLIPAAIDESAAVQGPNLNGAVYEYEPDEEEILADLLPRNVRVQVFRALLENAASEQGSRMTAMDSATRNAGDMINRLTITYNRTRQAAITKELIEIISGAEAL